MNTRFFSRWIRLPMLLAVALMSGAALMLPVGGTAAPLSMDVTEGGENTVIGQFDGLNLKDKRIWVDDTVYLLDSGVKVVGTSTKLGLITDIKQGEQVRIIVRPGESGTIPYVTQIYRQ